MSLYTYIVQPMALPNINLPHHTVSEIYSEQYFKHQGHYSNVKSRSHHDVAHLHPQLISL